MKTLRWLVVGLAAASCAAGADEEMKPGDLATVKAGFAVVFEGGEVVGRLANGERVSVVALKTVRTQEGGDATFAQVRYGAGAEAREGLMCPEDLDGAAPGATATVKTQRAAITQGRTLLGWYKDGQRVKVHYVQGGFVRVWFKPKDKDGKDAGDALVGYMSAKELVPPQREGAKTVRNPFFVDDEVEVIAGEAKLKLEAETLGVIPKGTRLTVKKIQGEWIGVYADVNGKKTFGWVQSREVDYHQKGKTTDPKKEGEQKPKPGGASTKE